MQSAGDAIFLMRRDCFVDCNTRTLEVFGCSREQIIGSLQVLAAAATRRSFLDGKGDREDRPRLDRGQVFEWEHCREDGKPFAAEVSLNRMELGGEVLIRLESAFSPVLEGVLVELLGGSIWVESKWGGGSTFGFELPVGTTRPDPARHVEKPIDPATFAEHVESYLESGKPDRSRSL